MTIAPHSAIVLLQYASECKLMLLGGSWVVINGVISPLSLAYNYSYPTCNPAYT